VGSQIILKTYDASKLSPGMPLRYLGIDIGQVDSLKLAPERNEVLAKAVLYPEYVQIILRACGSPILDCLAGDFRRRSQQPRYAAAALHQRGTGSRA
jgi:hypothetical protein